MATSEIEKYATLIIGEIQSLGKRFDGVDTRLDGIDARLDGINVRLDSIEVRLDHIESELSFVNKRLDALEVQGVSNAGFAKEIDELRTRVRKLEAITAHK